MKRRFGQVCLTACLALLPGAALAEAFHFVALGDTAYNGERDYPVYRALIQRINQARPAFTIHVGDLFGVGTCADWHYDRVLEFFGLYEHPVVYTPGDNEWTDCAHPIQGGFDPRERLARIREKFFAEPRSLGQSAMEVVRQSDVSSHRKFVENARWKRGSVLFATAHVVGSRNNTLPSSPGAAEEYRERNEANVAWIDDAFRIARAGDYKAVVLALHAELFEGDPGPESAFADTIAAIRRGGRRFQRPVLLIHGDFHRFLLDRPFSEYQSEEELPLDANILRLNVYGAPEIRAVRVDVDPNTPGVFGFTPLHD